jgi:hypothetical protein
MRIGILIFYLMRIRMWIYPDLFYADTDPGFQNDADPDADPQH